MKIAVPTEIRVAYGQAETRVAATPETIKKLITLGHTVSVQSGAGHAAYLPDHAYQQVGAEITPDAASTYAAGELIFKVRAPEPSELSLLRPDHILVGMLNPHDKENLQALAASGVTAFALEAAPRISRAQSLDVLSSQANIAGYKAVMLAAHLYQRFMPMLMTAAGTVKAARVLILGAGVAGLQAIATAKRLGAVIEASDVRPAVKEQIESLGAKFIEVAFETDEERECAQGVGGYARPMPASWLARQSAAVAERIKLADIVISTALIPGRKAPILITEAMVHSMKPGAVIIDMAVEQGGNCPLSQPGKTVHVNGVQIVGETNLAGLVAADASALYARNLLDFLKLIQTKEGAFHLNQEDEIVAACLMCQNGTLISH